MGAPVVWTVCLLAQRGGGLQWLAGLLRSPPLLRLGAMSYCVYLANEPVQKLLSIGCAWVAECNYKLFTTIWIPGVVLLPLLLACVLHKRVEQPALRAWRNFATEGVAVAA
jgi:peptidoglycan/LPS O-acetylase OafA/YrhL